MEAKGNFQQQLSSQDQRFFSALPLREEDRVIINIWSSKENKAVPGVNVGHVSIETPTRYISLWPGPHGERAERSGIKLVAAVQRSYDHYFNVRPSKWKNSYLDDCVSEAIGEHHYRALDDPKQCQENERLVAIVPDQGFILVTSEVTIPDGSFYIAVTPAHASVRIALYGLNIGNIHSAFERMYDGVEGWRLIGSNFLSRTLDSNSKENCASLAYRMLDAGGMYRGLLKLQGSSENSSVTKPDVLIKHAMAAKKKELEEHPETRKWLFAGESSLAALEKAYSNDVENTKLPNIKPEGGCSIS